MYTAYLYFKKFSREGVFERRDLNGDERTKLVYWLDRLVANGWIRENGDKYSCIAYRDVWGKLQTKRLKGVSSGRSKFRYAKLKDYDGDDFGGFKKHVLDEIRTYLANRLVRQIENRFDTLEAAGEAVEQKPTMLCRTVAKHLGFTSIESGSVYRRQYFKVRQSYKLERHMSSKGHVSWKYPPGLLCF